MHEMKTRSLGQLDEMAILCNTSPIPIAQKITNLTSRNLWSL